jgi:hypothetical protein
VVFFGRMVEAFIVLMNSYVKGKMQGPKFPPLRGLPSGGAVCAEDGKRGGLNANQAIGVPGAIY